MKTSALAWGRVTRGGMAARMRDVPSRSLQGGNRRISMTCIQNAHVQALGFAKHSSGCDSVQDSLPLAIPMSVGVEQGPKMNNSRQNGNDLSLAYRITFAIGGPNWRRCRRLTLVCTQNCVSAFLRPQRQGDLPVSLVRAGPSHQHTHYHIFGIPRERSTEAARTSLIAAWRQLPKPSSDGRAAASARAGLGRTP